MSEQQILTPTSTYKSSATLDNIIFHIRSYHPNIVAENELHQNSHCHFLMEIQYLYSGNLKISSDTNGKSYNLNIGDCCIIPGEHYHNVDVEKNCERLSFNWHIEKSPIYDQAYSKEYENLENIYNKLDDIKIINDHILKQLFEQYRSIANDTKRIESLERKTVLVNIIVRVMSIVSHEIQKSTPGHIKEQESTDQSNRRWIIEEHIARGYMNSDGISGLAQKLYLSERQTRTLILKTFGKNYKEMIVEQRMKIADIMIRDPLLSLDEISRQVGYSSYSGFYIAYVKYYGTSPEEKRKNIKKQ